MREGTRKNHRNGRAPNGSKLSGATVILAGLIETSSLKGHVRTGLGAIEAGHREHFAAEVKALFSDSLDLDKAIKAGHERENRWDYLLGCTLNGTVVAVEPHSAEQGEVDVIIRKRAAAQKHLRGHLKPGITISRWLWVASGKCHFADTEKIRRKLDQHGIEFVGARVQRKHLV